MSVALCKLLIFLFKHFIARNWSGLNIPGRFSTILVQGRQLLWLLVCFLYINSLLKRSRIWTERCCWQRKQILSFQNRFLSRRRKKYLDRVTSPERVFITLKCAIKKKKRNIMRKWISWHMHSRSLIRIQSTLVISTSLISNNRLSRSENLVPVLTWKSNKRWQIIVGKRRNCPGLFHNISYISLTAGVKLHIHLLNLVVRFIFSSILQIWYVEVWMFRSISEKVPWISR